MKTNPWFRMYSDFMFDDKIEFIAFEDQRHYIFILCMKNAGILDKEYAQPGMLERIVSKRLGIFGEAFESARKRLVDAELIDSSFQPVAWDKRQFLSDTSTDRVKAYRERMKREVKQPCNVSVTAQETDTDTETDKTVKATRVASPIGVSSSVWTDFVKHRKAKKSPITDTAIEGIRREADRAGWTMENALSEICSRGWTGFKADWVSSDKQGTQTSNGMLAGAI